MHLVSRKPRRRNAIGLTPLIDVVFILLLFFMLASQFHRWQTLVVSSVARGPGTPSARAVLVRVHRDGHLDLNGEPLAFEGLTQRLIALGQAHPSLQVQVESADEVPLQTLVAVFDRLQAAGIRDMQLR